MKNRKRCSACKNEVLHSGFNKNRSNPDGFQGECRECQNARARTRNRKRATAKRLKKIIVEGKVKKQVAKDKISDLELRAKGLFLSHLANYMTDEDADYKILANRAGYSAPTVSSYLNGPEKVSEQFIRQVSKKIPALAGEWLSYRYMIDGKMPEKEPEPVVPALRNDQYIVIVDNEILDADGGPLNELQVSEAVNDHLQIEHVGPTDCVIEVFKLVKMGYELNTIHDLTIYSSVEPQIVSGVKI